jgi:hypothetical protein
MKNNVVAKLAWKVGELYAGALATIQRSPASIKNNFTSVCTSFSFASNYVADSLTYSVGWPISKLNPYTLLLLHSLGKV